MTKLLVASLFCLAGTADAEPARPTPPPAPGLATSPQVCKREGGVLFSITTRPDGRDTDSAQTRVYDTGAWQVTATDDHGKVPRDMWGCLDAPTLHAMRDRLAHTSWKHVGPADASLRTATELGRQLGELAQRGAVQSTGHKP